jgi:hypothetical protein
MRIWPIFLFCLLPGTLLSQQSALLETPLAEITVKSLDLISLDTKDQIYASTTSGDIYLFDNKGKQLNLFSPFRQGRLQQLEAAWTVNIFSFSADLQEYRVLDRFLNPLAENSFLLNDITLSKAATLGNNNVVWVWDESDLSLKSVDYLRNLVLHSQPLNLILNLEDLTISEIREFKNRLFVNVPGSGIFIFDNQGNFIRKVNLKLNQRMCFYREHLLWIEGGQLMMYSLLSESIVDLGPLPTASAQYIQVGQESLVLAEPDLLKIYPLPQLFRQLK